MISTANDLRPAAAGTQLDLDMSVVELAIFVGTDRAKTPARTDFLSEFLAGWFGRIVAVDEIDRALAHMIDRGWLIVVGERLMPAEAGRRVANPLINGLIGMMDHAVADERRLAGEERVGARKRGIGSWF